MFSIAITYWVWIPVEIIFYIAVGYCTKQCNEYKNTRSLALITLLGCIPLWAFIAPSSKHLAFDMLLYDTTMTIILTATLIFLTGKSKLKPINYTGVILVIAGFILMKL